mmetsp:Transcript_45284/g.144295  ORF Transcript_45284/g.144295 Transcript_45284/m.144295 type:complete len:319 (+) Transcript_45284:1372-2328(+)
MREEEKPEVYTGALRDACSRKDGLSSAVRSKCFTAASCEMASGSVTPGAVAPVWMTGAARDSITTMPLAAVSIDVVPSGAAVATGQAGGLATRGSTVVASVVRTTPSAASAMAASTALAPPEVPSRLSAAAAATMASTPVAVMPEVAVAATATTGKSVPGAREPWEASSRSSAQVGMATVASAVASTVASTAASTVAFFAEMPRATVSMAGTSAWVPSITLVAVSGAVLATSAVAPPVGVEGHWVDASTTWALPVESTSACCLRTCCLTVTVLEEGMEDWEVEGDGIMEGPSNTDCNELRQGDETKATGCKGVGVEEH